MALYANIEKIDESEELIRYKFTDIEGVGRVLVLNKVSEQVSLEAGEEDMLYRAVASKVAVAWVRNGIAPDELLVQS
ncbi:hypothetical protein [Streptomyces sp. NPDC049585]|uniref:hypothetical protein n=1 Tax=Streptomyces sp. NPDC049585 TaxID=3155154 RepID=UPI00343232CF